MSRKWMSVVVVLMVVAMVLGACAPKATPTSVPTTVPPTKAPPTAVPPTAVPTPAGKYAGLRVALILPGSVDDRSWNTGAYNDLMQLKADTGVEVSYIEKVTVANLEAALRDYGSQGYDLIIAHSSNFMDAIAKVAPDFPKSIFVWPAAWGKIPANAVGYNTPLQDSAYLCGMLGGLMTKTNKLGYIMGAESDKAYNALGAYIAGAKLVNSKVEVISTFPGVWDDVEKGKESARAQIAAGVDVMMGRGDGLAQGVMEAVKEAGIYAFGDMVDQNGDAPKQVLSSTIMHLTAIWRKMLDDMVAGTVKGGGVYTMTMKDGAADIAPFHGLVPDAIAEKVMAVKAQIMDGSFVVPVFNKMPTAAELEAAAKPKL